MSGSNGTIPTLASLAIGKGLPADWLRSLGLRDLPGGGIGIPYYDADRTLLYERTRDLPSGPRFRQPAGVSLQPYGLWRLEDARRAGLLLLAEGESDTWVLWHLGLPALGLPGAQTCRVLTAEHLAGVEVLYLLPDADQAGQALTAAMRSRLAELAWPGRAYLVEMPGSYKDVGEMYAAEPSLALDSLSDMMLGAALLHHSSGGRPSRRAPPPPPPSAPPSPPRLAPVQTAAEIILEHLRSIYAPAFHRGDRVWSATLAIEVRRAEALARACDLTLMAALQHAAEAPRDKHGDPSPDAAPRLYRTWASAAWAQLLATTPQETETEEIEPTAERDFARRLSAALTRIITLARHRDRDGDANANEQQARSILDWCLCFARPSPQWQRLRSYYVWCRLDGGVGDRHGALRVAIRPELLSQLGLPDLAAMDYERFADLVERYGLGARCRAGRGGQRAIELEPRWLRALLTPPPAAGDPAVTDGDRACEKQDTNS